jgi:6-phosphogluconolactonase
VIALTVVDDAEAAARLCAERVAAAIEQARAERAEAHIAVAGGSTPARTYELLAASLTEWRDVHLWFGDERCVPLDHPDSNHRLLTRTLLTRLPVGMTPPIVHPVTGAGDGDPPAAAADYDVELRAYVPSTPVPQLDLALLGLGEDGHTASLFPDDPVLEERERLVVAVRGSKPPPDRVTFTLPLLHAARAIVVLTAGASKAQAVQAMLAGPSPHTPASLLGEGATVELITDRAAAAAALPRRRVDAPDVLRSGEGHTEGGFPDSAT